MRSRTAENHDRTLELRRAIDRTGYYPEVVADGVDAAVAGEQVVSFYVHHEPTFERDEVRRHLSVVVLTPTRLVLARTSSRVLILTTFDSDEYVYEALRSGASGFLLKDAPAEQLLAAVRCVAAGDALIDPSVTRRLIGRFTRALQPARGVPEQLRHLTARELDVLRLLAAGSSNQEIARELVVEDSTVKTHVGRVLTKLGLRDRVQAVVLAYETGFVVPDRASGQR